jgi:hypothetical protein
MSKRRKIAQSFLCLPPIPFAEYATPPRFPSSNVQFVIFLSLSHCEHVHVLAPPPNFLSTLSQLSCSNMRWPWPSGSGGPRLSLSTSSLVLPSFLSALSTWSWSTMTPDSEQRALARSSEHKPSRSNLPSWKSGLDCNWFLGGC